MPYAHTTWAQLRTELTLRLGDSASVFWLNASATDEIALYLAEALRTFGVLSGYWRERSTVALVSGTFFYALDTQTAGSPTLTALIGPTLTDRNIIQQIQFALLESTSTQASWPGTSMFVYNDVVNAVRNRRNQFLADTGCFLTRATQAVASPPIGRQALSESIIAVRRVAWQGASPFAYYNPMWALDERSLTGAGASWNADSGTPAEWSILASPPITLQIAPPPTATGTLDLLTVNSMTITPASSATVLNVPDNLAAAVKWGALADLLSIDGPARDLPRAVFCQQRYEQYVTMGRYLPCVVHAEVQGVSTIPVSLQELDASEPNWMNSSSAPDDVALAGWNMMAVNPVPDSNGPYSVTLDVIRNAPVPTADGTQVQIGREQVDMILDYAEHLAMFKVGGAEWRATELQARNFLAQALAYNKRLSATARAALAAAFSSAKDQADRPFMVEAGGVGAS